MAEWRERLADALNNELDEHGYEDDDEKRGQVAHHFADTVAALLEEETHWGPVSVPEFHPDGSPVMDDGSEHGFIWATPVHKHHFEWLTRRRWVSPWEDAGPRETSADFAQRLERERQS